MSIETLKNCGPIGTPILSNRHLDVAFSRLEDPAQQPFNQTLYAKICLPEQRRPSESQKAMVAVDTSFKCVMLRNTVQGAARAELQIAMKCQEMPGKAMNIH